MLWIHAVGSITRYGYIRGGTVWYPVKGVDLKNDVDVITCHTIFSTLRMALYQATVLVGMVAGSSNGSFQ